jgi:(2Fe-2S) ferredoxin
MGENFRMKKILICFVSLVLSISGIIFLVNEFKLFSEKLPYSTILGTKIWLKLILGTYLTQILFSLILFFILKKLFQIYFIQESPILSFLLLALICIFWGTIRLNQTVCLEESCKDGTGKVVYLNGDLYEGELDNYKAHGIGKLFFKNGNVYTGMMFEGFPHGEGELKTSEYILQTGFYKGKKNGPAKFIYHDGKIIQKNFKEDLEIE